MADLKSLAASIADKYGIPQNIFGSLVNQESGWNPNATGKAGEYGLTQLLPSTAASLGVTNPYDPTQNLTGGASYLSSLYKKYGSWQDALAAYNGGSPSSTAGQAYAASVLGGAGVTGSSGPGIQGVPPTGPGTVPGATYPSGVVSAGVSYIAAIVLVLSLVGFGVWGVMKGT